MAIVQINCSIAHWIGKNSKKNFANAIRKSLKMAMEHSARNEIPPVVELIERI